MEKQFQKGTEEFQMFADFYELCKKFWIPEEADEYWEKLLYESESFYRKYNSAYAKHLAIGLLEALDELSKKGVKICKS